MGTAYHFRGSHVLGGPGESWPLTLGKHIESTRGQLRPKVLRSLLLGLESMLESHLDPRSDDESVGGGKAVDMYVCVCLYIYICIHIYIYIYRDILLYTHVCFICIYSHVFEYAYDMYICIYIICL